MNLEYRINESYDRLTANDREVLNRILRNKAQSAGMNSTELAAFCHVSRTTLIRLFKKLGIGGFAEFRLLLKERAGMQELARLDMEEIISNYHRMVDGLKEYDYSVILEAIHEAGTIYLYGTGNEQKAIGEEFKRIFLMFGKTLFSSIRLYSINFRLKTKVSISGLMYTDINFFLEAGIVKTTPS